jgi:hypothetical protein
MDPKRQPSSIAAEFSSRVHAYIRQAGGSAAGEDAFNALALELFAFQFEEVLIYRRLCKRRGIEPASIQHWRDIPALPTVAFKEYEVTCLAEGERTHEFRSSGTTGQTPSRHYHNAASLALYEASLLPWFARQFFGGGEVMLFLTPPPAQAGHSSLVHMFKTVREKFGGAGSQFCGRAEADGSWNVHFDSVMAGVREAIAQREPVTLLGTAFSFVHWLDHLAENNIRMRLPTGSRILETGGYKGRSRVVPKQQLHRMMTRHLGVPRADIITEYGMCELSSQAYDGMTPGQFQFPPWVRTRIISPETGAEVGEGETGVLQIFDLANVYSVLGVQTEDLAISRPDGFELLGRPAGVEMRGCSLLASAA